MIDGLFIPGAKLHDVKRVVEEAMASKVGPLALEVQELREQMRQNRSVITHKQAPYYFDEDIEPETVVYYIKFWGLPAYKNRRKWYILRADLLDWQIGLIGFKEKAKEITIVAPRHGRSRRGPSARPPSILDARESSSAHHPPYLNESSSRRPESS